MPPLMWLPAVCYRALFLLWLGLRGLQFSLELLLRGLKNDSVLECVSWVLLCGRPRMCALACMLVQPLLLALTARSQRLSHSANWPTSPDIWQPAWCWLPARIAPQLCPGSVSPVCLPDVCVCTDVCVSPCQPAWPWSGSLPGLFHSCGICPAH